MPLRGVSLCSPPIMPHRTPLHAHPTCKNTRLSYPRPTMRRMSLTSPDDAPTDALRAAGWQPVEPLPCGCTPDRLCAPHGWLRDAEQWERYIDARNQASLTPDL